MRAMSGLRRALGEPLLQFIVMGALLFAGYRLVHPERPAKVEDNRIELTAADVRQLEIVWTAQWHRAPTQDELQGLVESRVREEILYREALALGLERGDTIIKRRLAQKMEFLADDLSAVRDPSVEELRAWYSRNSARFADPGRRSFRHLYFSADRRGDRAQQDATRALVKLGRTPADATALSAIGDAFMFQEHYADRTPEQVAAIFGSHFAEAVRQLPVGTWQGPIESGLGWHLVLVTSATPGRVPAFDEIEAEIQAAWMEDQRSEARRRAFDVMKARYEVRLPALSRAHERDLRTGSYWDAMNARSRPVRAFEAMLSLVVLGLLVLLADARHANAHEARPAYLALTETAPDRFDLVWRTPVVSGMRLPVVLQLPDGATNVTSRACTSCPIRSSNAG